MAIDQVLVGAWRNTSSSWWRWLSMIVQGGDGSDQPESFVWRQGKSQIKLTRAGDSWQVSCRIQSRLMGPRQTVYEARHRQAKFAAWDVMARVISISHDEEIGVEVAVKAAQWMRRTESSSLSRA